jgi:hypothetical protein
MLAFVRKDKGMPKVDWTWLVIGLLLGYFLLGKLLNKVKAKA